jgi:hypothetical protein
MKMSTRCQVIVKDQWDSIWFYRHCDGDPKGVMPSLEKFLSWVKSGKIRNNAGQSSGWLVIIGHNENKVPDEPIDSNNWKVGAFEPCTPNEHGDIKYLYTIDLVKEEITYIQK